MDVNAHIHSKHAVRFSLVFALLIAWTIMAGVKAEQPGWSAAPNIVSVLPNPAKAGDPITVAGTGFGATQGTSQLNYDGAPLAITSWSATQIQATLPSPKDPGTYDVQVTVGTLVSNIVQHTISAGGVWGSMIWGQDKWGQ